MSTCAFSQSPFASCHSACRYTLASGGGVGADRLALKVVRFMIVDGWYIKRKGVAEYRACAVLSRIIFILLYFETYLSIETQLHLFYSKL